jgi:hypothetical protein
MWLEAVLQLEDLDRLLAQFAPLTIALGAGRLHLSDPSPCELVPDVGLRVVCKAKVHWPMLGIDVPVTAHSLSVLLRLEVARVLEADVLVFKLEIENVDLAGIPGVFDRRITEMVNAELVRKEVGLTWAFARALTHSFELPAWLEPAASLGLTVVAGRVKIVGKGIGLAVQFESSVKR